MTDTLFTLLSILIGIVSAVLFGFGFKRFSQKLIGNTIAGVFGSILLTKILRGLFDSFLPATQATSDSFSAWILPFISSVLGAVSFVVFVSYLRKKLDPSHSRKESSI